MQWCALCLALGVLAAAGASDSADKLLKQARTALDNGKAEEALGLASKAVELDPKKAAGFLLRGVAHERLGKNTDAVADYSKAIEIDPKAADAYQGRGSAHFKLGKIAASITDFDKYLELRPERKAGHWQRGISYYYAGRYEDGQKQFEGYQTVDSNDVENVVWRYLCMARRLGPDKARADLLKVGEDKRVPMKEIYGLFAGKVKPADVLGAARAGQPPPARLNEQLFYANLYVGLYLDAQGNKREALKYLDKAAEERSVRHYMWDVARVHRDLLRRELDQTKGPP
jgi:lipoprotein NlpI